MTWQLSLSAFLIFNTASYIYRRKLAVKYPEYNRLINGFFYLFLLYPLGLIIALISSPDLNVGWFNLLLLLAGGIGFPLGNFLAFRASKTIDAGIYTILTNIIPIVTIITAWFFLDEGLTERQLLGAAIVLLSTFLITTPLIEHRTKSRSSSLATAIAAVIIIGLAVTYERYMLTRVDFGAYLIFGWGAQVAWMVGIAWPQRKYLKLFRRRDFAFPAYMYGLSSALKGVCFVSSLKLSGNASLVSAFSSFVTVLVVLAAYFFLRETQWLWLKIFSAAIGIIGMIILNS